MNERSAQNLSYNNKNTQIRKEMQYITRTHTHTHTMHLTLHA